MGTGGWIRAGAAAFVVAWCGGWARADYARPDPPAVRQAIRDILDDSRFQEHTTFADRLIEWLLSLLDLPGDGTGVAWVGKLLMWALLVAGVLALLLLVWYLVRGLLEMLTKRSSLVESASPRAPRFEDTASYPQLRERIAQLARQGEYREAVRLMMAAAVRGLEAAGILRFHPGKTNGEYVREFPAQDQRRGEFRAFALAIDGVAYGDDACGPGEYEGMLNRMQQVVDHGTR